MIRAVIKAQLCTRTVESIRHFDRTTTKASISCSASSKQVEAKLQEAYEAFVSISEKVLEVQRVVTGALKEHHQKLLQTTKAPAEGEHVVVISGNV